ncbi:penicillin acylase family protein [Sinomicrobium sp.]
MKTKLKIGIVAMLMTAWVLPVSAQSLSDQVVIHRTEKGVPHIMADNIKAAFYAMGYLQLEDYGMRTPRTLLKSRGEWTLHNKQEASKQNLYLWIDARARRRYKQSLESYYLLNQQTKDMMEGFAAGVNRYIEQHPDEFPDWLEPDFTAADVHAGAIGKVSPITAKKFLDRLKEWEKTGNGKNPVITASVDEIEEMWRGLASIEEIPHPDTGSNVWALAPERTTSGHAILMRNPHLNWKGGYYEAHIVVPDTLDFYGDFRVGGPLGIVGGFNRHLGWSTTNNYPDVDEVYALERDPNDKTRYIIDGKSHPMLKDEIPVSYITEDNTIASRSHTIWSTPFGDVIKRTDKYIYIIRSGEEGRYSYIRNQQFLSMMMAKNLDEWKAAMSLRGRGRSNFTYADADGNIFYVWNGSVPKLPHASGNDTTALYVKRSDQIWKDLIPFDKLPQLLNPKGGYLHNENDPFHYTNLNEVFDEKDFPSNFPKARLRLRSQLSLQLIGGDDKLSLEEVVKRKHSMRAILGDRVKPDLVKAVRATNPTGEVLDAIDMIDKWDNTVARESRGGILFQQWWKRYVRLVRGTKKEIPGTPESAGYNAPAEKLFTQPWTPSDPTNTPYGLASKDLAVEAFEWAIKHTKKRYGAWDVKQGEVNRAHIGDYDFPVGGATGDMGTFRVMWFKRHTEDRKKSQAYGGDGWILAVEFGETPRAYSVLPYGNSNKEDSPYYADQLEMFTENKMKPVIYKKEEVIKNAVRTYRP